MKHLSPWLVLLILLFSGSLSGLAQCPSSTPTIAQIQGAKSTTAAVVSPYAGQTVQTCGIVTAITSTGFFIQEANGSAPAGSTTGIYVNTTSAPPASVVIGTSATVQGVVSTVPAQSHIPANEITVDPTTGLSINPTIQTLPLPVALDSTKLSSTGSIYQLTPYEGMRVSFASLTAVSGTGGTPDEADESYASNGQFYAVITSTSGTTARPFRTTGIDLRDATVPNTPANVAVFNDNPQRILIDSGTLTGSTPIDVATGAVLTSVTGVLDFTSSADSTYTPARLLVDPSYSRGNVDHTFELTVQSVPATASNQFTIVSLNLDHFYNASSSDDTYYVPPGVFVNGTKSTGTTYPSSAVDATPAAYQARLAKTALAICTTLNTPDIIALEGIENQSVATDIATAINTQCSVQYNAYSTDNTNFYTLDSTGISTGFLLKNSTIDGVGLVQAGGCQAYSPATSCEVFTPTTGSTTPLTLNARPWLILTAGVKRTNAKDYPVVVILNDLADIAGENSTTSTAVRQQKEIQAEEITTYIQSLQAQKIHVISIGNFNAFEFSDGYTDTLATYTNNNVLPSTQVVQPGKSGIVTPALDDLTLTLPQTQRWSYVDNGNAEVLEHFIITSDLASTTQFNYVHFNADFPADDLQNASTPAHVSSHDAAIGYFVIPPPVLAALLTPVSASFGGVNIGTPSAGQQITLYNVGEAPLAITGITASGDFAESNNCGTTLALNASCTINIVFTPTAAGARTGTLLILTNANATAASATLTGTGVAPDFTLADSSGNTTTTVTVAAGATGNAALVFTPVGGFSGTIATTCTAQGTAPTGVTCTPPASFALSGTAAVNQTVSFTTTSRTLAGGIALGSLTRSPWSAALILALSGLIMFLANRTRRLARISGLLLLLLAIFIPTIGCSGGGGNNSGGGGGGGGGTNPNGTPAGTYTYTVTATSGSISHAETVKLVVQ